MSQERRRAPRVNYPCKVLVSREDGKGEFSIHTENISSGGVRLVLEQKIEINTPIDLEIEIGKKTVKTKGRVVWVLDVKAPKSDQSNLYDTGVEFTQLSQADRDFLSKLIEDLMQQPKWKNPDSTYGSA